MFQTAFTVTKDLIFVLFIYFHFMLLWNLSLYYNQTVMMPCLFCVFSVTLKLELCTGSQWLHRPWRDRTVYTSFTLHKEKKKVTITKTLCQFVSRCHWARFTIQAVNQSALFFFVFFFTFVRQFQDHRSPDHGTKTVVTPDLHPSFALHLYFQFAFVWRSVYQPICSTAAHSPSG